MNAKEYRPSRSALGIIFTICGAGTIAIVLRKLYQFIHTIFFASLPDAEVQTYVAGLAVFLFWLFLSPWWTTSQIEKNSGYVIRKKDIRLYSVYGVIGALASSLLFFRLLSHPDIQRQLGQMGIASSVVSPFILLLSGIATGVVLILLSARTPVRLAGYRFLFSTFILGMLPILTFYVGQMAYYDATHFIGPIHDAMKGIAPLTSPSWYGFLPIGLLSLVFRLVPLTLSSLYITIAIIEMLGYMLFYWFTSSLFKSYRWAAMATVLAVLFHFLVQFVDRNYYLQSTFLRFGIWLPLAGALFVTYRHHSENFFRQPLLLLTLALSFFWTTDTGLYTLGAYLATVAILQSTRSLQKSIRSIAVSLLPLGLGIAALWILISAGIFLWYHVIPDWSNYWQFAWGYRTIRLFALPMPRSPFPIFFLTIPLASIGVLMGKRIARQSYRPDDVVILFLSILSLFLFTYYTGDSHLNSLHTINLPVIVCLTWLLKGLLEWSEKQETSVRTQTIIALSILGSIPITLWSTQAIQNFQRGNIMTSITTIQHPAVTEYNVVGDTAVPVLSAYRSVIQRRDFALISPWDSYYLLLWNTTNTLGSNCLLCYWTPEMAAPLIRRAKLLSVSTLFVDRERTGYEGRVSWIFTPDVEKHFHLIDRIGQLDVYKRVE